MIIAADYPFLDIFWTMVIFFAWVCWIWIAIMIFSDIFRRHDIGGFHKAVWIIFIILVPFLGVLVYLIANSKSMTERRLADAQAAQAQFDEYVKTTAGGGGAAAEIEKANALLQSGAITDAEFASIKAKALAAG